MPLKARRALFALRVEFPGDTFPPDVKTASPEQREFAGRMMCLIMRSFFHAYYMHADGITETELLIDYDIEAAYNDVENHIRDTIRNTIQSACKAVDSGVDYATAQSYLNAQLHTRIDTLLTSRSRSRSRKQLERCIPEQIGLSHIICPWCGGSVPVDQPLHDCQQ